MPQSPYGPKARGESYLYAYRRVQSEKRLYAYQMALGEVADSQSQAKLYASILKDLDAQIARYEKLAVEMADPSKAGDRDWILQGEVDLAGVRQRNAANAVNAMKVVQDKYNAPPRVDRQITQTSTGRNYYYSTGTEAGLGGYIQSDAAHAATFGGLTKEQAQHAAIKMVDAIQSEFPSMTSATSRQVRNAVANIAGITPAEISSSSWQSRKNAFEKKTVGRAYGSTKRLETYLDTAKGAKAAGSPIADIPEELQAILTESLVVAGRDGDLTNDQALFRKVMYDTGVWSYPLTAEAQKRKKKEGKAFKAKLEDYERVVNQPLLDRVESFEDLYNTRFAADPRVQQSYRLGKLYQERTEYRKELSRAAQQARPSFEQLQQRQAQIYSGMLPAEKRTDAQSAEVQMLRKSAQVKSQMAQKQQGQAFINSLKGNERKAFEAMLMANYAYNGKKNKTTEFQQWEKRNKTYINTVNDAMRLKIKEFEGGQITGNQIYDDVQAMVQELYKDSSTATKGDQIREGTEAIMSQLYLGMMDDVAAANAPSESEKKQEKKDVKLSRKQKKAMEEKGFKFDKKKKQWLPAGYVAPETEGLSTTDISPAEMQRVQELITLGSPLSQREAMIALSLDLIKKEKPKKGDLDWGDTSEALEEQEEVTIPEDPLKTAFEGGAEEEGQGGFGEPPKVVEKVKEAEPVVWTPKVPVNTRLGSFPSYGYRITGYDAANQPVFGYVGAGGVDKPSIILDADMIDEANKLYAKALKEAEGK